MPTWLRRWPRLLALALLAGAVGCFFLPFLTVEFEPRRAHATGIQLVTDSASYRGEYQHASYEGDVETVVRNGRFWAIPSFALAALALILALLPSRATWVGAVVASVLGVLTLLALFQGTSTPFHPPFPDRRYGFWLAIFLLVGGGTTLAFWLREPASYRVSDSRLPDWLRDL
ncbi:MAG TPA: hypothetical protein VES61_05105 [Gaiellaceae bacterium]|nr:hypothetical protein [Gaiellaceae bacterium]